MESNDTCFATDSHTDSHCSTPALASRRRKKSFDTRSEVPRIVKVRPKATGLRVDSVVQYDGGGRVSSSPAFAFVAVADPAADPAAPPAPAPTLPPAPPLPPPL